MKLEDLYKPDDVPARLRTIHELQDRFGRLADEFEVWRPKQRHTADKTADWFPVAPSDRLITIGTDNTGGLYVLWCREGRKPADAPVAFLGSEGEGNTVLAENLDAFFELLGTGASWGPYDQKFYPPESEEPDDPEEPEGPPVFREHYRKEHGEPRTPEAIREAGEAAHPGFDAWVEAQCAGG